MKKMIGFKVEDYEAEALKVIAQRQGKSQTDLLRDILREKTHAEMLKGVSYIAALKKIIKEGK